MKTHKVRPVLVESKESTLHLSHGKLLIRSIESTGKSDLYKSIPQELILISLEDEKIEVEDIVYHERFNIITHYFTDAKAYLEAGEYKKVIARQSQIPPEYISKFIEQYNTDCVEDFEIEMMYKECPNSSIENWNYFPEPLLTNGFVSIVEKEYSHNLLSNMQYYMEYCQANGYVTPQDWLNKFKHYSDRKKPISYTEEEVNKLLHKFLDIQEGLNTYQRHASLDTWFENNKKK